MINLITIIGKTSTDETTITPDKIFLRTLFDGSKVLTYTKKVGNTTYSANSIESLKKSVDNHKEINQTGAAEYYGTGRYNGD